MLRYINFDKKDENSSIYRIISVERLIEMFKTNSNVFVSPSLWEDPFEHFLSKTKVRIDNRLVHFNQNIWGQCWTKSGKESDAMWRIYAPQKNGVRIKTNIKTFIDTISTSIKIKNLKDEIENSNQFVKDYEPEGVILIYCGNVKYLPVNKILEPSFLKKTFEKNYTKSLFVKRLEFEHEKEFRFVIEYFNHANMELPVETIFSYKSVFQNTISEILFDPRMDTKMFEVYKSYLVSQGYQGKIRQSGLYKLPKYNFNL